MTARAERSRTSDPSRRGRAATNPSRRGLAATDASAATASGKSVTAKRRDVLGASRTFREQYQSVAVPRLREVLGTKNVHALPRITKVLVASGVGKRRAEGKFLEDVGRGLALLAGQKPSARLARQSIAGFKVRSGLVVGLLVTLRGRRMEDFLTRLLVVALPRVRDFRGIPLTSVDARGNLSIGIREASVFPEVDPAVIETPFGFQVTIVTTAGNRERGLALFHALAFPFAEKEKA